MQDTSLKDEIRSKFMVNKQSSVHGVYARAYSGSKSNAVKAKCLDCACDAREEIKNCTVYTCPLYEVRPYQAKIGSNE